MEYERIQNPTPQGGGGGGISPSKLRLMLLGVDIRRKEGENELEYRRSLRSEAPEINDRSAGYPETCKDVDMVCFLSECSSATTEMASGHPHLSKDLTHADARVVRSQEDEYFESDSALSSTFEFQRAERAQQHRPAVAPLFSKPAPSKWDDAQKWIASPTSNRTGKSAGVQPKKMVGGILGYGSRQCAAKVLEVTEEADTKGIDLSLTKKEVVRQKPTNCVVDPHPVAESYPKPTLVPEVLVADSAVCLSHHGSSALIHSSAVFVNPVPTVRSVSMRDMGTEMTPIASQEPSRTGTPVRAAGPIHSPTSSRPSTPGRAAPISSPVDSVDCEEDSCETEFNKQELQMKTRREIMVLGTQLGKLNIAAWARKEEDNIDESVAIKTVPVGQPARSVIEIRAAAWEEAEKAKYLARFKREEIKIQAWENHQKAKTEAEMRKIEVEVERMRARAHEKLMNKLAMTRHKAEEKRVAAEGKRNQQAARSTQQAEYIRRTGRIPSSFSCWSCCG